MTAQRVIASVEPLLSAHIKHAHRHGLDVITIPVGRAVTVMHELQHLRDTMRREQRAHPLDRLLKIPVDKNPTDGYYRTV